MWQTDRHTIQRASSPFDGNTGGPCISLTFSHSINSFGIIWIMDPRRAEILGETNPQLLKPHNICIGCAKSTKLETYKIIAHKHWTFRKICALDKLLGQLYSKIIQTAPLHRWCSNYVDSSTPNITFVGATCRSCQTKNQKVDLWLWDIEYWQ